METYTEQEAAAKQKAAAKMQKIIQLLTDGTLAARKLSQPLDAALRPKVLTEALRPFEAATSAGTADGLSIYGAAKSRPLLGNTAIEILEIKIEHEILKDYGRIWRYALIDFVKAWRDLLQAKAVNPQTVEALKQLEYGVEDCIEGVKEWTDENGWPTGESAPRKYFTLLQQFKIQVADILDDQPIAETATKFTIPKIKKAAKSKKDKYRQKAAALIITTYVHNNDEGEEVGLERVLDALLASKDSELAMIMKGYKPNWKWTPTCSDKVEKMLDGWLDNDRLDWSDIRKWPEAKARYYEIKNRNNKHNKNKPNKTEGKNA